jgi:hypothetical protein
MGFVQSAIAKLGTWEKSRWLRVMTVAFWERAIAAILKSCLSLFFVSVMNYSRGFLRSCFA